MTECPKCKGYGIVGSAVPDILRGRGHIFSSNECDRCHGSGEVSEEPMTNEEYLRTANVDDMATMIATKLLELARHEYGMCDVVDRDIVLEWLKQPHHSKE